MEYLIHTPVASIIFIFTVLTSIYAFNNPQIYGKFMLHPYSIYRKKEWHTFITSGFIHADWSHLLFNMFTFVFFAFPLEQLLGHFVFAVLYLLGMILSDIPTVLRHKNSYQYHSLGASGAISAVLFSYILFFPLAKIFIMFIPIGIPAVIFGLLYLVYCWYMSKRNDDNINHDAHFFGALVGILLTILVVPNIIGHFLNTLLGIG
ncbi:MAG: rhomboid family intramembrane serine protease [Sphingobacteriaceae bacterium]|nr:rhomboid family intramembrane serine protease [Sphingobacteriaceae bacterium]